MKIQSDMCYQVWTRKVAEVPDELWEEYDYLEGKRTNGLTSSSEDERYYELYELLDTALQEGEERDVESEFVDSDGIQEWDGE